MLTEHGMRTNNKIVEPEHVSCKTCLKEIPLSEAKVPEANDYAVHFCGLECYEKWRNQSANPVVQEGKSAQ